jgi:thiol:disulfide interchange protein DsbC
LSLPGLNILNILISLLLISLVQLSDTLEVSAFGGCGDDCEKCHTLTPEEARNLLKKLIPDIKLLEVRPAPARGLWEVSLKTRGRKGIAYIDYAKENVIVGQIWRIKTRKNLTQQRLFEITRVDFSRIPLDDAIVMGDPDALHKIVVFDDPD